MRRLMFPVVMPHDLHDRDVLTFKATLDQLRPLGEPGFIEGDWSRTVGGGRDISWAFETNEGLRFEVQLLEPISTCRVMADPPDPARTVSALRALGLEGLRFDVMNRDPASMSKPIRVGDVVWVFISGGAHPASVLFSSKRMADPWLARTRSSGVLLPYAFGISRYEFSKTYLYPEELPPPGSLEAQRFIGTVGERYEYREGTQLEHRKRWQLWREYDDGSRFLLEEFDERSEAEAVREQREREQEQREPWQRELRERQKEQRQQQLQLQIRRLTYSVREEEPLGGGLPEPGTEPAPRALDREEARVAADAATVWAFFPEGTHWPTAVFWSKPLADKWLARHAGSGILQAHTLDHPEAPQAGATSGEWYEYLEGKPFERGARWQLWRQDDNGGRFVMTEFEKRYEAMAEMETMERRGHKQTYWVAPRETPGAGGA